LWRQKGGSGYLTGGQQQGSQKQRDDTVNHGALPKSGSSSHERTILNFALKLMKNQ
jgi:hypothetical protein